MTQAQRSRAAHVRNLVLCGHKVHEAVEAVMRMYAIAPDEADYLWFVPEKLEVIYDASRMRVRGYSIFAR